MTTSNTLFLVAMVCSLAFACDRKGELSIARLTPVEGRLDGDQPVKILGQHFRMDQGYTVYFGTKKSPTVTIMDTQTILAMTPEQINPGAVDVTIYIDDGSAYRIPKGFEYRAESTTGGAGAPEKLKY